MFTAGQTLTQDDLDKLEEISEHVRYLSIDPGKSNGICGYNESFDLQFMVTIKAADMVKFLHSFHDVKVCIIEDFLLYPNKSKHQSYSDMETSRVIGRVETWSELKKVYLHKQGALIKKTGYAWLGKKPLPKSNPMNHSLDAHVHFVFWAVKNRKMSAADLLKKG